MALRDPLLYARDLRWAAWEQTIPAWTSTGVAPAIGNGSIVGRFRREGAAAFYRGAISIGTTTTFGTGEWRVALPTGWVAGSFPAGDGYQIGDTLMVPTAGSAYSGFCWAVPAANVLRLVTNAAIPASITNAVPAAWTANAANFLSWNIALELD